MHRSIAELLRQVFLTHVPPGRTLAVDTNFFEAGFNSARLAGAVADLGRAGTTVTLLDLFRHPTIAQLADELLARAEPGRAPSPHKLPWDRD